MTRTADPVRNDAATLKQQMHDWSCEGRLDSDAERDLLIDLSSLEEELESLSGVESRRYVAPEVRKDGLHPSHLTRGSNHLPSTSSA